MDELRIRVAEKEDVGALTNLVTESGKEVVGMVGIRLERTYEADGSCARVMALVVSSEHRGRGAGQALMCAVEEWARRRGAQTIVLTTHKRRAGTHRFYRKMGYEATGYRYHKSL